MHFGDCCGAHSPQSPFGAYREITLAALWRAARLGTMDKARLALVTSTDCDLPRADVTKRRHRGFVDERSLLEAPGVAAWFATNPNDHLLGAHPKLKAVPLGVQHRGKWSSLLDGREARNRTNLLACCCLSSHPVPSQSEAPGAPKPHASFKTLDDPLRKEFEDQSKMLSAEGLQFKYAREGWVGSVYGRIRRYAVVEALRTNGFGTCSHRGPPGTSRRPDQTTPLDKFAAHLLESDFAVSPQGIGRACHREWEALSAGAIPLVDWDASPAMAELYSGLPVVRTRIGGGGAGFLKEKPARSRRRSISGKERMPAGRARFTPDLQRAQRVDGRWTALSCKISSQPHSAGCYPGALGCSRYAV